MGFLFLTPLTPLKGGNVDGFYERECDGFLHSMMPWLKAIKTTLALIYQKSHAPLSS